MLQSQHVTNQLEALTILTGEGTSMIRWKKIHRNSSGCKVMHDGSRGRDGHIYHMLRWKHAKQILDGKRLRLSPVRSWDDPYEKWWCEILFGRTDALSGLQAYGLCCTTGIYDEPRWRMAAFRRAGPIVRVRCAIDGILNAGAHLIGNSVGSLYLGKVRYKKTDELHQLATSVAAGKHKDVTRTAAAMLLQKRIAFKFENEVRLLWLDKGSPREGCYIEINPPEIISQFITSPYVEAAEHRKIKDYVEGFEIPCKRSLIMTEPPLP